MFKKFLATSLSSALVLALAFSAGNVTTAKAADDFGPITAFIAYGGDIDHSASDWGYQYYGEADYSGPIVATNVTDAQNGDTVTISLQFPEDAPSQYSWFFAPTFVVEDASAIGPDSSFDIISFSVNGEDRTGDINFDAHPAEGDGSWDTAWIEATGAYDNAIRTIGGYNEWNNKAGLSAALEDVKSIEYTIQINLVAADSEEAVEDAADDVAEEDAAEEDAAADDATDDLIAPAPEEPALPETGTAPVALFVGLGGAMLLGGAVLAKKERA